MLEQVMAGNGSPVPLVEGGDCRVFQFHSRISYALSFVDHVLRIQLS